MFITMIMDFILTLFFKPTLAWILLEEHVGLSGPKIVIPCDEPPL